MRQLQDAASARSAWTGRLERASFEEIAADAGLMRHVRDTGRTLFVDNCAACHGVKGTGGPGFPNLASGTWLWGGDPETLADTIRVGINSTGERTRTSQMLAFGRDGVLTRDQILGVSAYVRSLSGQRLGDIEQARTAAGREVFAANCASCHGDEAKGSRDLGAPDLTDPALDLRRRRPVGIRQHPWRSAGPYAPLAGAPVAGGDPDAGALCPHAAGRRPVSGRSPRARWRLLVATVVIAGAALLVAANTHLVHVALISQPDCVPHARNCRAKAAASAPPDRPVEGAPPWEPSRTRPAPR
jgi:mono/diheme cytochrome c family protein